MSDTSSAAAEVTTVTPLRDSRTADTSEFDRMKDLARRIVNVPKKEIDAERQKG